MAETIPIIDVNTEYKRILNQQLQLLKEQKGKIEQGIANLEDEIKRLDVQNAKI